MKEIVEYLNNKNIMCKSLQTVLPKVLGSRKKVDLYVGVNLKDYYCLIMKLKKKSRVLRKEVYELIELHERIEKYMDTKIKKKYIIIEAPLCTHAKAMLEEYGWMVWHKNV